MRPVLSVALATLAAAAAFAQSTGPALPPSTGPSTKPATQPAVRTAWAPRPTPMLTAMLGTRSIRPIRPPFRRGFVPFDGSNTPGEVNDILRARVAATRAATSRAAGPASRPKPVMVVVNSKRPATRPVLEPSRVKLDIDAPTAPDVVRQLSAAFGQNVRMQDNAGLSFHGHAGTFAAAVAEFFDTSGLTVSDQMSDLTLVTGKPLRVVNLNDVGTLVLSRITLSARRSVTGETPPQYDYAITGIFVPDPAMGVVGISAADGVTVTPGVDRGRSGSPYGFQNIQGFRVNLNFSSPVPLKKADSIAGRLRGLRTLDEAAADVSFDAIAEGQPVERDGVTATVTIPPQAGSASLRVSLTGEKMTAFRDYRYSQSVRQFVRVLDLDGSILPTDTYPEQVDANTTRLMVRSNMRASDFFDHLTTVRVRVPITFKALDLPFELKNVDLPGE